LDLNLNIETKKQLIGLEKEILSSEYLWFASIVNQFEWPIFYVGLNRWIIEFMTNQAFNLKHSIVRILEFKKTVFWFSCTQLIQIIQLYLQEELDFSLNHRSDIRYR